MIPSLRRSALRSLDPLPRAMGLPLEDETPLIAADPDFAWEHGGPLMRAFVESLSADGSKPVVIDSSLVWLAPGLAHGFELGPGGRLSRPRGPLRFVHEPFPGVTTGVRGASNRNLDVVHRMCVLGLGCTPEVAEGDFAFTDTSQAEAFWLPSESLEEREAEIERRLAEGTLTRTALPLGIVVEFGWGTLMRARPAATTGFQLIMRATIGDPRPHLNSRRNLSIV